MLNQNMYQHGSMGEVAAAPYNLDSATSSRQSDLHTCGHHRNLQPPRLHCLLQWARRSKRKTHSRELRPEPSSSPPWTWWNCYGHFRYCCFQVASSSWKGIHEPNDPAVRTCCTSCVSSTLRSTPHRFQDEASHLFPHQSRGPSPDSSSPS